MDNMSFLQVTARLAIVTTLAISSGCLVTVSHFDGGNVTSDLGADCQFGCSYQLNEGDSLSRVFTAVPLPGNEFVRWSDSLGQNFSICPQPTNLVCTLVIGDVHPLLEGQKLDVEAQFRAVNAYNANSISFVDSLSTAQGNFIQIDNVTWVESYPSAVAINYYFVEARSETRLTLFDNFSDVRYFFDFAAGTIRQKLGAAAISPWGSISGVSSVPTARLVARIQAGTPSGSFEGDYIQTAADTWVFRKRGKNKDKYIFSEKARDDTSVFLRDDSRDVDIVLNLIDKMIYSSDLSGQLSPVGVIQRVLSPLSGLTVSEVHYGGATGETEGFFLERGINRWLQVAADGKTVVAEFSLLRRSVEQLELTDLDETVVVRVNFQNNQIRIVGTPIAFPIDSFEVRDAN